MTHIGSLLSAESGRRNVGIRALAEPGGRGASRVRCCLARALLLCQPALADTLEAALAYAYANNPQLNSQRAVVRATDEGVPTALAGYRPKAVATANVGMQSLSTTIREIGSTTPLNAPASYFTQSGVNTPHGVGATVTQNLLNGFQTANRTRLAESQVFAARETLRNIEQTVLLNAATAYMNLLRDAGILELQRSNLDVLRSSCARPSSGCNRATSPRPTCRRRRPASTSAAPSCLPPRPITRARRAVYRQVIGLDPGKLAPAAPVDRFTPHTLPAAMAAGIAQNPAVAIAQHNVDVATHQVKVAEGALYPTVSLQGSVQKNYELALNPLQSFTASGSAAILGAALSGRRRICRDPAGQGDPGPEAARPQRRPRPGPHERGAGLGAARGRQELDRVDQEPGEGGGSRRSTACARKPASASAPRSTCSTPSRSWSTPGSPWWSRSATGW